MATATLRVLDLLTLLSAPVYKSHVQSAFCACARGSRLDTHATRGLRCQAQVPNHI